MKKLLLLSLVIGFAFSCKSQSFFAPLPKPTHFENGKLSLTFGQSVDSIVKSIRPVAVLSANVSDGAQLAGGAGIGYQRNVWDATSQSYITQYSISLVGLLGTNGLKLTGTGGLVIGVPGTNGLVGIGGGYDFTLKQYVFISGVQLKFN
jgi:hypothetical protein